MRLRRTFAAALAVLFALVATGCAEDPEPKFAAPTTASPTEEPTETEAPEPEGESPEEFIRRWQAAADAMVSSGETEAFRGLSRGCEACASYADRIENTYAEGGSIDFDGSRVTSMQRQEDDPPTVVVTVRSAQLTIRVPGREPQVFPAAKQIYRMTLAKRGQSWVLRHYGVL